MKCIWPLFQSIHALKERLLPRPFERIALQNKSSLVGAEIGVFEGEHARLLLRNSDIQLLYLVDPYKAYDDYPQQQRLDDAKAICQNKLYPWRNKIAFFYETSKNASILLPDNLDFVYLDGAHNPESIRQDIKLWWLKIRDGGILGGHDFSNGLHCDHYGVVQEVARFVVHNNLRLVVELSDWWVVKPKK